VHYMTASWWIRPLSGIDEPILQARRDDQPRASIAFWISTRAAATPSATFFGRYTCRSWSVWRGFARRSSSSPRSSWSRAPGDVYALIRTIGERSRAGGGSVCPGLARQDARSASHDSITRIIP
jgi:hypothetical protein